MNSYCCQCKQTVYKSQAGDILTCTRCGTQTRLIVRPPMAVYKPFPRL
jgi:DNA-directed RNA polymerase subunit RPC12/RpoP